MVRAPHLTAEAMVKAMETGDFYASTGVTLSDIRREGDLLTLAIKTFLEWKQARAYELAERAPQEGILPAGTKVEHG